MAPNTITHHRARVALATGLLALVLASCGSDTKSASSVATVAEADAGKAADEQGAGVGFAGDAARAPAADAAGGATATTAAGSSASGSTTALVDDVPAVDRKVIVTVTLDVVVTDVGAAAVKAATLAEGTGGYVFSQQTNLGERPSSSIVLKVPPAKVGGLLTSLGGLGTVLSQTQQAEDVTAQFVDLESRITAARASVARVREFLDRTTNVGELAGLEGELTRRQTELEQLLGQQRVLASRTDLATVTLTLVPEVGGKGGDDLSPASALRRGVDSIANVGRGIGIVAAFLLPWLPVVLVVAAAVAVGRRRRRRRVVAVVAPPAPPAPPVEPEREKVDA